MTDCILCKAKSLQQIEAATPGVYYHCRECDLIFLDSAFYLASDEEKKRYDTHENTLENAGYVEMFTQFLQNAVLPYAKPMVQTLDFGCGPGPVLQALLQRQGFATRVYDPYYAPTPPDGTYGLITTTEALEHVCDPKGVWTQLMALLEPGGVLAIMTHFHGGVETFAAWWYRRDPTHVTFFSERTFQWLASAYGLSLLYSDGKKTLTLQKHS